MTAHRDDSACTGAVVRKHSSEGTRVRLGRMAAAGYGDLIAGLTGGDVGRRIANARLDPTFLMADVEIVASYELYNVNRTKLENVIHRVFDPARLDIEIKDRFGNPVIPREWFLVPGFVVDEAVERIKDGTITNYIYDPKTASLVRAAG